MNPFSDVKEAFKDFLEFMHEDVGLTFGWAIVATTLIVRLLILPLFIKQYRSMRRMQAYAPQIKELQARYKGNRQKLNEEMMSFYKENQINPFSSCLPLVAQLPIFIVLYYALRDFSKEAIGRAGLDFMWIIPDVAQNLLDIGWGAGLLLAIYAISQLLAGELNHTPATPTNQRWIMRLVPIGIVFGVTTFPVPAGVVIYWVTTNLWTCGQQLVIKRKIGPNPYIEEAAEAAGKEASAPSLPPGKRTSRTPPRATTAVSEAPSSKKRGPRGPDGGRPEAAGKVVPDGETPDLNGPSPEPAGPAKTGRRRPRTPAPPPAGPAPSQGRTSPGPAPAGEDDEGLPQDAAAPSTGAGPDSGVSGNGDEGSARDAGPTASRQRKTPRGGGQGGRRQPKRRR